MTLHDLLDDVARDEPLVGDASAAWVAGRARRPRRLSRVLAAVAAVLGLLALTAPALPLPAPGYARPTAATGRPVALDQPWAPPRLPERPGALAALVDWPERTWARRLSWVLPDSRSEGSQPRALHAVSPQGRVWVLPDVLSAGTLSPDGRVLAGLRPDGAYVVRDLVSGRRQVVEGVAARSRGVPGAAALPEDSPARWSPDGRHVAYHAGHALVLDVERGSFRRVPPAGVLVGWRSGEELVWLQGAGSPFRATAAVVTDLLGQERDRVPLSGAAAQHYAVQGVPGVTGDGRMLVLPGARTDLQWFDLTTGLPVQELRYPTTGAGVCGTPAVIAGSPDLLVTGLSDAGPGRALRLGPELGVEAVVEVSPPSCPTWAAQALAGPALEPPLLLRARAVGALGLVAGLALLVLLGRRRA